MWRGSLIGVFLVSHLDLVQSADVVQRKTDIVTFNKVFYIMEHWQVTN